MGSGRAPASPSHSQPAMWYPESASWTERRSSVSSAILLLMKSESGWLVVMLTIPCSDVCPIPVFCCYSNAVYFAARKTSPLIYFELPVRPSRLLSIIAHLKCRHELTLYLHLLVE